MKDFRRWLWITFIVVMVIAFLMAYMRYFVECSNMEVSEMPWYCLYLLSK